MRPEKQAIAWQVPGETGSAVGDEGPGPECTETVGAWVAGAGGVGALAVGPWLCGASRSQEATAINAAETTTINPAVE